MIAIVLGLLGVFLAASVVYVITGTWGRGASVFSPDERRTLALWRYALGHTTNAPGGSLRRNMRGVHALSQQMTLDDEAFERLCVGYPRSEQVKLVRGLLKRRNKTDRLEGVTLAFTLDLLSESGVHSLMVERATTDRAYAVRLRAIAALAAHDDDDILDQFLEDITACPEWFLRQIPGRFSRTSAPGPETLLRLFGQWRQASVPEAHRAAALVILIRIAGLRREPALLPSIREMRDDPVQLVSRIAVETLTDLYEEACAEQRFLTHRDEVVVSASLRSLARRNSPEDLKTILQLMREASAERSILYREALVELVHHFPATLDRLIRMITETEDRDLLCHVAPVLATRAGYLLRRKDADRIVPEVFAELIFQNRVDSIIAFVNRRSASALPALLVGSVRALSDSGEAASGLKTLSDGLSPEHRIVLGLPDPEPEPPREADRASTPGLERVLLGAIPLLLVVGLGGFFVWRHAPYLLDGNRTVTEILGLAMARFNYTFLWYSLMIHSVYSVLLFLAKQHHGYQNLTWNLRISRLLFDPEVLPGITMLVPAHNEEKNIVVNIHNLLRIHYPDYRLIVINDGSVDGTMQVLDDAFDLERVAITRTGKIETRRVRAVYRSRTVSNLTVVDKVGGGKADALNVGINLCTSPLFCTIDADSVLEPEALIRAVFRNLMSEREAVAVGGTILPANGCSINGGWVENPGVPRSTVAAFQMVEYLRSFLAGRLGWARINALAIISGAFGVFSRRRTIEAGGYLTSSGAYRRATMGEDMELVVRLGRLMQERNRSYAINFAGSAVCWTEVPERLSVLYRQRRRWQRGLLETLYFHRKLVFNPKYGSLGTLGLAYFFLFEVVGPFIEVFGYVALAVSAILGTLNYEMALLIFCAAIGYGMVVTATAIGMSLRTSETLRGLPPWRLLWLTVVESLGYRQWMSATRLFAYFSHLFRSTGWSQPARKGIGTA